MGPEESNSGRRGFLQMTGAGIGLARAGMEGERAEITPYQRRAILIHRLRSRSSVRPRGERLARS